MFSGFVCRPFGFVALASACRCHSWRNPWAELFSAARDGFGGGYVGAFVTGGLWWALGRTGTLIALILIMVIGIIGIGRRPLIDKLKALGAALLVS